jgi:hypothetical protein
MVQVVLKNNSQEAAGQLSTMNETAKELAKHLTQQKRIAAVLPYHNSMGPCGNLMNLRFKTTNDAALFYDQLELSKGPMVGTNDSVAFPCAGRGYSSENAPETNIQDAKYVRVSVGTEPLSNLKEIFGKAMQGFEDEKERADREGTAGDTGLGGSKYVAPQLRNEWKEAEKSIDWTKLGRLE